MEESDDNMSAEDMNSITSPSLKSKPKKRSLVERELETSLTAKITSPVSNHETTSTSRYGRARRLKNEVEAIDTKTDYKINDKSPNRSLSAYKMHASNSPVKSESIKDGLNNQIENIYNENISLSRFCTDDRKHKSSTSKTYTRKDLLQTKEKDETVILIKNMFSPDTCHSISMNTNICSEKSIRNRKDDLSSVVKTLDFDGKKKKKQLSQSDLFDLEAQCEYQVGDLVWARVGTYPFWPSIVTRESSSMLFVKKKLFGRLEKDLIHVIFLGDNGRHGWVLESMLRKYLGLHEFETTRNNYTSEAKKRDPRLYAAFFISEKKLSLWNLSVGEAEMLLREPKRLRIDILNGMLSKSKENKEQPTKSKQVTRTNSDVSLSESLYDSLFSEDDCKQSETECSKSRTRNNKSFDVSDVVTACLDNMAAKTGITKIQKQSHMDRWLQKAKSKTPEKCQNKLKKSGSKSKIFVKAKEPINNKRYMLRKKSNESQNGIEIKLLSHQSEHDYTKSACTNGLNDIEIDLADSESNLSNPESELSAFSKNENILSCEPYHTVSDNDATSVPADFMAENCTEFEVTVESCDINDFLLKSDEKCEILCNENRELEINHENYISVESDHINAQNIDSNTGIVEIDNSQSNSCRNENFVYTNLIIKDNECLKKKYDETNFFSNITNETIEIINDNVVYTTFSKNDDNECSKKNFDQEIQNNNEVDLYNGDKTFNYCAINTNLTNVDYKYLQKNHKQDTNVKNNKFNLNTTTKTYTMPNDTIESYSILEKEKKCLSEKIVIDIIDKDKKNLLIPVNNSKIKSLEVQNQTENFKSTENKNTKDNEFNQHFSTEEQDNSYQSANFNYNNDNSNSINLIYHDYNDSKKSNVLPKSNNEVITETKDLKIETKKQLDIFFSEKHVNIRDDVEIVTTNEIAQIDPSINLNFDSDSGDFKLIYDHDSNDIIVNRKEEIFKPHVALSTNMKCTVSCNKLNIDSVIDAAGGSVNNQQKNVFMMEPDKTEKIKHCPSDIIISNNETNEKCQVKEDAILVTNEKSVINKLASDRNCIKNLEFIKYLEQKQDTFMDENPDLSHEEITAYLYKTWQYEESLKSDRKLIDDKEQSNMVKGLDQTAPEKKHRKKSLRLKSNKSKQTLINFRVVLKDNDMDMKTRSEDPTVANSNNTINLERNVYKETIEEVSSNNNKKSLVTDPITEHINFKEIVTENIFEDNEGDQLNNSSTNIDTKKYFENFDVGEFRKGSKTPIVVSNNKESIHFVHSNSPKVLNDIVAVHSPIENDNDDNINNINDISHSNDGSSNVAQNSTLLKAKEPDSSKDTAENYFEQCPKQNKEIELNSDIQSNSLSDKNIVEETQSISDYEIRDSACSRASTLSSEDFKKKDDVDVNLMNSDDSEVSSKRKTRKQKPLTNPILFDNPDFVKYLELRQDQLVDEHPELSQEEVISYLYNTWSYEEDMKSETKKSDDLDQKNLVKGLNQDPVPIKRLRKKVKVIKDKDYCSSFEEVIPKDKSRRRTGRQFYREEDSDFDDDLEIFQIFRPNTEANIVVKSENSNQVISPNDVEKDSASTAPTDVQEEITEQFDQVEEYFRQLTQPKPNLFKGLVREKVCEICEKVGNLVKCKGCYGMFHTDCTRKVVELKEAPIPVRGRKKKRKNRGRKHKGFNDSFEENSDDRSQDHDGSFEYEMESHTIANADDFEQKLSAKLKEMIENPETKYDTQSSDDELSWSDTDVGKCKIVDIIPKKKQTEITDFKCKNCEVYDTPLCFVCKGAISLKKGIEHRQKCQIAHCNKYYHIECLVHWPQTQFNTGERNKKGNEFLESLSCPRHVCHTCVCDDPRGCKTRFSGDKLARCVRCPATYHTFTKCLPAGTQILSGSHIVCPRHYEHRPGKVPCHVNTGWCFICALGGSLICCEYCPTSFHAECLNIEPPEGRYMCEDCETGCLPLYGAMVWVKLGHYRWWPGLILHPSEIPENIMAVKHYQGEFVVRFFGQYDHYWVNRGRVFPFQEGDTGRISSKNSKIDAAFAMAVEHAQRASEILKNQSPNNEGDEDIASSLLPPHYVKLKVNKPCGSLVNWKVDPEESSLTQCECDPTDAQPCGPYSHCLNRMLLTECGSTCRAGDRCSNRAFEKRLYPRMEPYRTSARGWGLRTLQDIRAGQFVIEYVGELIDEEEFQRRMKWKHEVRDENYYFLTLDKERMIDAGPKGNLARFMNHSCDPNCETQKWTVLGDVRVGLFALYDIPANSELTFNYNLECAGIEKKRCMCGTARCSGFMGAKPKQEEPKKNKVAAKRTYKKRKPIELSPTTSKPKRSRPKNRELTDIEKDLLIIKSATNGISSDSEGSGRLNSVDSVNSFKRKRSYYEENLISPSAKKAKHDRNQDTVKTNLDKSNYKNYDIEQSKKVYTDNGIKNAFNSKEVERSKLDHKSYEVD